MICVECGNNKAVMVYEGKSLCRLCHRVTIEWYVHLYSGKYRPFREIRKERLRKEVNEIRKKEN